ncbi:MAG: CapA family protein [Candidatus Moranbacteria bacterium]|nr:CapA family protein [Candidatus Moranbacteria bacterium]
MIQFSIFKNRFLIFFLGLALVFFVAVLLIFANRENRKDLFVEKKLQNNLVENSDGDKIVPKKLVKILFVGDIMLDRYVREAVGKYGKGNYNYVFDQIRDKLAGYDLVVGNLEGPITDKSSVSVGTAMDEKKNLVFSFDPAVAKALASNNIKLVDLGNNHILNQDEDGVAQTKKYLDEAGIQYFGNTGGEGNSFLIKNIGGTKIGFVNYNYSVAGSFEKAIKDIEAAKKKSDIVVVCPHWGTEYIVGDPGQKTRSEAYELIDAGADAIIGGHPHVIEDSEVYKNKKIYYSLGNFIFDQYFQKETMEGLGVELTVNSDLTMEFNELKFEMTKRGHTEIK